MNEHVRSVVVWVGFVVGTAGFIWLMFWMLADPIPTV